VSGYSVDPRGILDALGTTTTDPGAIDLAASADGNNLYVRTGQSGNIDSYLINGDGSLTYLGAVTVPDAAGGEGIVVR
jgi:hypothetical protein